MDRALSAQEVEQIAGCSVKVIKYQDLDEHNSIDDIFSPDGCALLLYETMINSGHWVCLINSYDTIYFFDSYGLIPDNQLAFTNIRFREENDMMIPHLTLLFSKTNKEVDYNDKRLQVMREDIQTCGRWCGYRMRNREISNDSFNTLFKGIPRQEKDIEIVNITDRYLV